MNEHMICVWNDRVKPEDEVYHLGDVMFPPKDKNDISIDCLMERLNGTKHLIVGNHDRERYHKNDEAITEHPGWASVKDYDEVKFGKTRFVICHYPFETWRNAHRGWYMLHGHCHGTLKNVVPHRMDVGVDCVTDYAPISAEELRDIFNAQADYSPTDHHGEK
jgi:calcineurin-like phosphoesterase family protein